MGSGRAVAPEGGIGRFERSSSTRLGGLRRGRPPAISPAPAGAAWTAEEAFRDLAPPVLAYLRGQGAPEPEDLLGEVFLQVARSIGGFSGSERDLRRWVFAIARNRLVDDRRHRARRPQAVDDGIPEVAADLPAEVDADLHAALVVLTPEQREVIGLRFVADLSLEEVADLTGRPVGAVKSMQHRALATLARSLADGAGGPS